MSVLTWADVATGTLPPVDCSQMALSNTIVVLLKPEPVADFLAGLKFHEGRSGACRAKYVIIGTVSSFEDTYFPVAEATIKPGYWYGVARIRGCVLTTTVAEKRANNNHKVAWLFDQLSCFGEGVKKKGGGFRG